MYVGGAKDVDEPVRRTMQGLQRMEGQTIDECLGETRQGAAGDRGLREGEGRVEGAEGGRVHVRTMTSTHMSGMSDMSDIEGAEGGTSNLGPSPALHMRDKSDTARKVAQVDQLLQELTHICRAEFGENVSLSVVGSRALGWWGGGGDLDLVLNIGRPPHPQYSPPHSPASLRGREGQRERDGEKERERDRMRMREREADHDTWAQALLKSLASVLSRVTRQSGQRRECGATEQEEEEGHEGLRTTGCVCACMCA